MPESRPVFSSPGDLAAPAGYSQVVSIPSGRLVWTSGQVPMDTERKIVGAGDWAAQTRAVFGNLERALRAGGAGWADVVKLTLFVVDVSELDTIRAVRDGFVDTANPPTSSLVQVAGLFHPDVLIEIEAVAWRPG